MKRRDLIAIAAGAAASAQAAGRKFFTPAEYALADELTELIIPADDHSGGARAAKVAEFIDYSLAEAFGSESRDTWRKGLKQVESLSQEMHHAAFLKSTPEQRVVVLERMSKGDSFFAELKSRTIQAYYTSKIGIHDEMGYLGNVYQRGDYSGFLPD